MTRQVQEVHDREGEVVVYCSMEYSTRSDGQMVAARIRKLGLTGYGRKLEQAEEAVTELFVCMVESHRSEGILAQHLNNLEVRWSWEQDCSPDELASVVYVKRTKCTEAREEAAQGTTPPFRVPVELAA